MVFNLQKFLIENKLTKRSRLEEDAMTKTDAEQVDMSDEEMFGDDEEDSYYKDDSDDMGDFEKEPVAQDIKKDEPSLKGIHKKQAELKALEDIKDELLMQLNSGQMGLDQYKQAIESYDIGNGEKINIPAQIKKLRADIKKEMTVGLDDEEELA